MLARLAYLYTSVFFVGKLPIAPGTWGSFTALLIWLLIIPHISSIALILITTVIFVFGVYASSTMEKKYNINDPSFVVIDEWVGQWIALLFLPQSVGWGLFAFFLFRIFDIWKPNPIRKLDDLPGGWGIMLDDVLAGIYALVIVQIVYNTL